MEPHATTLAEVKAQAEACTACRLAERRRTVVFGVGNPQSPLVLVGEGPGEEEDRTGVPFVGRAGKLLDQALMDNGLDRTDVYICNTVKCRACDWRDGKPYNRPPAPDEIAACSQWLDQQLRLIAPKVILCVGAPSANTIIRKGFQITKERGKKFSCEYAKTAIATLHPAYILRQMGAKSDGGYSLLVEDIALAWMEAQLG
ncbi:MAG: uracil-DNA glycosylase [Armatimonadetes bacterium]|nr:uracil-DNA glycosylase [Armatimonadota bacterium]NOG92916.1 uracil-DNA glycosylase [Armatimonadota bacterium]